MKNKKVWEARISDNLGKLHNYKLSPKFETVEECQKYIDENLKDIEEYLTKAFNRILQINLMICLGGSFIRCYNTVQKRWVSGFDW